jgi:hypothetical protein
MTDPKTFLQRTHQNLLILKEREAKYGGNAPLELLNQIEDHEKAIFLTRHRLDGHLSDDDWREALAPLILSDPTRPAAPSFPGDDALPHPLPPPDDDDTDVTIIVQGDITLGDQFNLSGDFRGAALNLKSTLNQVNQRVEALPGADESLKAELQRLIAQLSAALQLLPPEQAEAAEAVAQAAHLLVNEATDASPNQTILQISGEGLKQAARSLADLAPAVVSLAEQLVQIVRTLER